MDTNVVSNAELDSKPNCATDCKQQDEPVKTNKELVSEWINSSNFDETESILSDSSAVLSSLVESDDHDFDFASLTLKDNQDRRARSSVTSSNNTNVLSKIDILQHVLNKDSSVQTVGNVNIENSSQVHIGNVTYITGPIHITNPSDRSMEILFNSNTKTVHTNMPTAQNAKHKVPSEQEEAEVSRKEETKRDDAFLPNIKRRIASGVLRYVDRRTWLAQKPMEPYDHIDEPVEYVIISHSATELGTTQADNIYLIRHIQCYHVESCRWNDIGYNFMIGGDGNIYEGRGWGVVGAHTKGYNTFSVGICFVGCFMRELPPEISLKACKQIIQKGIDEGYIVPNYKLIGHCQCAPTESPGRRLFEELKTWDNFSEDL